MPSENFTLKVMSYNINGLAWPLKKNPKQSFLEIGRILHQRKTQGTAPDVLLIQEGYRPATRELVAISGYAHWRQGPEAGDKNPYDLGQNGMRKALIGSGLWILSNYPILESASIAYGAKRCAGYDCLSNKGLMFARIEIPNLGPVDFFNTHMNCYGASGCPPEQVAKAQKKQLEVAGRFIEEKNKCEIPVIFAGDFNIKTTDTNANDLIQFSQFSNAGFLIDKDFHTSVDHHLYRESSLLDVTPIHAAKTMEDKIAGVHLSDHFAYEVSYQFSKKTKAAL